MDWSSFLSALLGGFLALAGQAVQAHFSRSSELRQRGEAAALAVRDLSQQIESLYPGHTDKYGRLEDEHEATRDLAVARLRGEALVIPKTLVRQRVIEVGSLLGDLFAIEQFGGGSERTAVWQLARWLETILGCYLRRESQPAEPDFLREHRAAISDAHAAWEEEYQMQRELPGAKRESSGDPQNGANA